MENQYLIIDRSILPAYYDKVIEARSLVENGRAKDVSEAARMVGISRSTYYKYKDYVFAPNQDTLGRKAVVAFNLVHRAGALSEVLKILSDFGANILTITQNLPINGKAHVLLSFDTATLSCDVTMLLGKIGAVKGVSGTKLIAIE